jgi:hypothetical protein
MKIIKKFLILILCIINKKDFIFGSDNKSSDKFSTHPNQNFLKSVNKPNMPKFIQIQTNFRNPDQVAADSGGGDSGEFLRRNQPQEHIFIPLIDTLEAEYLIPEIRKYRKIVTKPDKGIKLKLKIDEELNKEVNKIISKK